MYVVVNIDRQTGYCSAYGPYASYFDACAWRCRLESEDSARTVYVIALESAR